MSEIAAFLRPAQTRDAASVLDGALEAVRTHLDMPVAYLSAFEGRQVVFKSVVSAEGFDMFRPGDARAAEGSYCKGVVDGILPQLIPDTALVPAAAALDVTQRAPIGAIVSVPVHRRDGAIYGMFCCLSPTPKPTLNTRDLEVMTMFARLAADVVNTSLDTETETSRLTTLITDTITDQDFSISLQPIVDLRTGEVQAAEALSRFRRQPYATPDVWFQEAQRVGLAAELELATLAKALKLLPLLPAHHRISLNVSSDLITNDALLTLLDGAYAERITLEITEHAEISTSDAALRAIQRLRALGIRIAMDDLGAGYSGLCTMLKLKPDILKMDRALVKGVHLDPGCQALTTALVYFAGQIGADLIAEGIETQAEADCLLNLGVALGQGYLFGKPDRLSIYLERSGQTGQD